MALWRIKRIDSQAGAATGLDCLPPAYPVLVTLEDTESGTESAIAMCINDSIPPCQLGDGMLYTLGVTYTPNDFGCG